MSRVRIFTASDDQEAWRRLVSQSWQHDVYHLPGYHLLSESMGHGASRLFIYEDGSQWIALPILIRPLAGIQALGSPSCGLHDATSVYGYSGPVASHASLPQKATAGFQRALGEWLKSIGVVGLFSRLHPLIDQVPLLGGIGETVDVGTTVSIDLTLPPDEQAARYRKGHRYEIKRAMRDGIICQRDARREHLDAFVDMYHKTMDRVGADDAYYFSRAYFRQLFSQLGDCVYLFCCFSDRDVACAGLFTLCGGIVQYHLSASCAAFQRAAPTKLMIDTVRLWATERGAHTFHLGGGVGAREDSLFSFKAGFSPRRHTFKVWKWIVMLEEYQALCRAREEQAAAQGIELAPTSFFPEYRAPITPLRRE